MNNKSINTNQQNELSEFQKYVLQKIIYSIDLKKDYLLYDLIKDIIYHKDISSDQQKLIDETYDAIRRFLIKNNFAIESKELIQFSITAKGAQLKEYRTIEEFEDRQVSG